jgi:hypothetical protein
MTSQAKFVVSIHIPKTAGTTLAEIMSRCYNKRVIYDYDGYSSPETPSSLIQKNTPFIQEYFVALHGHFYAKKYFDIFPNAAFVSAVRHPVDRVVSQYLHEMNEESSDAWYHDDIVSGRMDLPTFAAQPGIGDAMSLHLQGRLPAEYDLLIIMEQLRMSLALFEKIIMPLNLQTYYGIPVKLPVENFGGKRERQKEVREMERQEVFTKTAPDNAIYAEALRIFEQKVAKFLQ